MRKTLYNEINRIQTVEQPLFDVDKERIMNHLKKEIKPKRPVFIVLKSLSTIAACFVLLITASAFSPVLAENIPFMQEIVQFLKQEQVPRNSVIAASNVEDFMQPANDTTKDEMQILEAYCDGTALVLTVGLEMPDLDEDILRIIPAVTVDINGERLYPESSAPLQTEHEGKRLGMFLFHRTEDDKFLGALTIDVSGLNLTEDLSLTLEITELTGENPKLMVATSSNIYDPIYEPKTYALENPTVPHTITVPVDTSLRREYTVEESVENLTVHKLTTTPLCTHLEISRPDYNSYYYTVTTEDGTELSYNKFDNSTASTSDFNAVNVYRDPLPEGTEKVIVTVYPWDDKTTPIGTVEIPVEFGYASGIAEYAVQNIPEEEIVYDPPIEELLLLQPEKRLYDLGETITSQEGRDFADSAPGYLNPDATIDIIYDNMQVYDSPADIGLSAKDLYSLFRDQPLAQEGRKFVTFDVTMETHGIYGYHFEDEQYQAEIEAYEKNDGTAGILWINNFAIPEAQAISQPYLSSEVAYFSGHPTGTSNYYQFVTNAYDTHNFVIGFYVPDELLESGEWRIGVSTGEDDPNAGAYHAYYTIPPVSLNE